MWSPSQRFQSRLEVKKSRFLAICAPLPAPDAARGWLKLQADPSANHNTYAWIFGEQRRYSDDGEPGGCAGLPIYQALKAAGVDRCILMVRRYFGGIKLGRGGMIRAYGRAAAACLAEAPRLLPMSQLQVFVPFSLLGAVAHLPERFKAQRCESRYDQEGLHLLLKLEAQNSAALQAALLERGRGQIYLEEP